MFHCKTFSSRSARSVYSSRCFLCGATKKLYKNVINTSMPKFEQPVTCIICESCKNTTFWPKTVKFIEIVK